MDSDGVDGHTEDGAPVSRGPRAPGPRLPGPVANFEGLTNADNEMTIGGGTIPPDTVGDVGPNHYVQMVNQSFEVFTKTGTSIGGPKAFRSLFSVLPVNNACRTEAGGDPVVLYDPLVDRWLLSSFSGATDFNTCVAVSQTADPSGQYFVYSFPYPFAKFNDYPKLGVWPDGIYVSFNQFDGDNFAGSGVGVIDKAAMYAGASNPQFIMFDLADGIAPDSTDAFTLLPSDIDGTTLPPPGATNTFVGLLPNSLNVFEFHADFTTPANSTFTGPSVLNTASFDENMCNGSANCIPQPGTSVGLDALSTRLMHRNAHRVFVTHRSIVVNHTVDVDNSDHAGVRWYELRSTGTAWGIDQQGTLESAGDTGTFDGVNRWMGSVAQDKDGNIGLGYSASSSSVFPSIRYVGRLPTDPPGTLPQGETVLHAGGGSQAGADGFGAGAANRWGDYSAMSIDPSDDCTFWYTNEYHDTTNTQAQWKTRIGSFRFPSCTGGGAPPTISVSDANVTEGDAGTTDATFTVSLSAPASQAVTVQTATSPGTATADADYETSSGTVSFPPNETVKTIVVPVIGDTIPEPTETFIVTLSNPNNATIADGTGTGTITDDDAPVVSIGDFSAAEGTGAGVKTSFLVPISLSAPAPEPVMLTISTTDGSAVSRPKRKRDFFALKGESVVIPAGQQEATVEVLVKGDKKVEPVETFTVTITNVVGAAAGDTQSTVTIVNDD